MSRERRGASLDETREWLGREVTFEGIDDVTRSDIRRKLEVYCFANCANTMPYYRPPTYDQPPIPWIESFGNQHDVVARLGMLAPNAAKWQIAIDGPRYVDRDAWGHLLNQHYLIAVEQMQKVGRKWGGHGGRAPYTLLNPDAFPDITIPRLFSYINGGSPNLGR